jgi:mRNA interferase MazF
VTASPEPHRGEIWLVSFGAARHGEPGKNRPALVLSADELLGGGDHELVVVVPLSSSVPRSALRPKLGPETGIDVDSVAIPRAIRGLARRRLLRRLGRVDTETLAKVERALAIVLSLDRPDPDRAGRPSAGP